MRKLKLHTLVGHRLPPDPTVTAILKFFDELFDGLQVSIIPEHNPVNVIYHKGGKFYMEQDNNYGMLMCRKADYWDILKNQIGLGDDLTRDVTQMMVSRHIGQSVSRPAMRLNDYSLSIDVKIKNHDCQMSYEDGNT